MAKQKIKIPLASSYNTRGQTAYANSITNDIDQRKVNSYYEKISNAVTGRVTLYLCKRPGAVNYPSAYGNAASIPYLIVPVGNQALGTEWVFSRDGNDTEASNISGSNTISTNSSYYPTYVDKTTISGTETVVLQLRHINGFTKQLFYFASSINSWTQITDADFVDLIHMGKMEHIDGYALQMTSNSRIYNSDLNSLANWDASAFITKQMQQDVAGGLAKLGKIILSFGGSTVEGFFNAGNPSGSPLQRIPELNERIGLSGMSGYRQSGGLGIRNYYCVLKNRLYFIGNSGYGDSGNNQSLYMFDGSRYENVSNAAVEKILGSAAVYDINTVSFLGQSAIAISLSDPNDTPQTWMMFFPELNEWFEWNSTQFQPTNSGSTFIGIGDGSLGATVYYFSQNNNYVDGVSAAIPVAHQFRIPDENGERKFMNEFGLVADTDTTSGNVVSVQFSDDDEVSWSTARNIDMGQQRKLLFRGGSFYKRSVRLTHSHNSPCRMQEFIARVD